MFEFYSCDSLRIENCKSVDIKEGWIGVKRVSVESLLAANLFVYLLVCFNLCFIVHYTGQPQDTFILTDTLLLRKMLLANSVAG